MLPTVTPSNERVTDPSRLHTHDELFAEMPESNQPCELWDGELIMSPVPLFVHQEIVFRFQRALHDWVTARGLFA